MNVHTDGMQPHVQGSATPADLFKRTTAGSLWKWSDRFTMKIQPDWGCVMEYKRWKPTSDPRTPGRCSVTTACSKHWKQLGFAQSPRSMPGRRRWGGRLCWKPVAKKQHIKSYSMGPEQHKQFHCLMAIHFNNYKVSFIKLECPALE